MVLGHSRWLWGRFCATQDLQTVLRCHIDAFAAVGGAPSAPGRGAAAQPSRKSTADAAAAGSSVRPSAKPNRM
jgi:hypothetical protein